MELWLQCFAWVIAKQSPSAQFPMPKATFIVSAITIYYILHSFSAFVTFVKLSVNLLQSLRSNLQRWNLNIYSTTIYSHCYSKKVGDWEPIRSKKHSEIKRCLLFINKSNMLIIYEQVKLTLSLLKFWEELSQLVEKHGTTNACCKNFKETWE